MKPVCDFLTIVKHYSDKLDSEVVIEAAGNKWYGNCNYASFGMTVWSLYCDHRKEIEAAAVKINLCDEILREKSIEEEKEPKFPLYKEIKEDILKKFRSTIMENINWENNFNYFVCKVTGLKQFEWGNEAWKITKEFNSGQSSYTNEGREKGRCYIQSAVEKNWNDWMKEIHEHNHSEINISAGTKLDELTWHLVSSEISRTIGAPEHIPCIGWSYESDRKEIIVLLKKLDRSSGQLVDVVVQKTDVKDSEKWVQNFASNYVMGELRKYAKEKNTYFIESIAVLHSYKPVLKK